MLNPKKGGGFAGDVDGVGGTGYRDVVATEGGASCFDWQRERSALVKSILCQEMTSPAGISCASLLHAGWGGDSITDPPCPPLLSAPLKSVAAEGGKTNRLRNPGGERSGGGFDVWQQRDAGAADLFINLPSVSLAGTIRSELQSTWGCFRACFYTPNKVRNRRGLKPPTHPLVLFFTIWPKMENISLFPQSSAGPPTFRYLW